MSTFDLAQANISEGVLAQLQRFGFDADSFGRLQSALRAGEFPPERNQLQAKAEPPQRDDFMEWPEPNSSLEGELCTLGQEAIDAGHVAVAILNGGMATRFGGQVKGVVEVLGGKSFLSFKLRDVARRGKSVPVFLMNSFATARGSEEHLATNHYFGMAAEHVHCVNQNISLRLTPDGKLFRDERGRESLYAPGHGDLFEVLANSGSFQAFVQRGGRNVLVSNVDNLAATLSTKVIGAHIKSGKKVTVEVAPRAANDAGGAPVRYQGKVQVVEGFRFPPDFNLSAVPVFNTNTMTLSVEAVHKNYDLTWFRADKSVERRQVVQFERLMGEVTAFVDSNYLAVPRNGPEGRFLPVKTPEDLITIRPVVRALFPERA